MNKYSQIEYYEDLLKKHFGFNSLRDSQKDVLAKLQVSNVLAVLPTGSGKSMCFILPAIDKGKTVVVSPLISLMQEQSNKLIQYGIKAGFINSSLSYEERDQKLKSFRKGEIDIIYVAPERFTVPGFLEKLAKIQIRLLAIDEAHCISEWGHNFRPDYLNLSEVRKFLKPARTIAMTATADEIVRKDIIKRLNMDCKISLSDFNRPNLFFYSKLITKDEEQNKFILNNLKGDSNGSTIIYCRTRKSVESTADYLNENGIHAIPYHAGFDSEYRKKSLLDFTLDHSKVIVATNAFGMGIDKPDVRKVFHKGMTNRLEEYYQESGRAGRDGKKAECILIFKKLDFITQKNFLEGGFPTEEEVHIIWKKILNLTEFEKIFKTNSLINNLIKSSTWSKYDIESKVNYAINCLRNSNLIHNRVYKVTSDEINPKLNYEYITNNLEDARKRLRSMIEYCETLSCKRQYILNYFGDDYVCKGSTCCSDFQIRITQSNLRLKLEEFNQRLRKKYGAKSNLIMKTKTLEELESVQPTTETELLNIWGFGEITKEIFGLDILNLVKKFGDPNRKSKLKFTETEQTKEDINDKGDSFIEPKVNPLKVEALKNWRNSKSKELGLPAYIILWDDHIREIVLTNPKNQSELRNVKGIGDHKAQHYGEEIIEVLRNY